MQILSMRLRANGRREKRCALCYLFFKMWSLGLIPQHFLLLPSSLIKKLKNVVFNSSIAKPLEFKFFMCFWHDLCHMCIFLQVFSAPCHFFLMIGILIFSLSFVEHIFRFFQHFLIFLFHQLSARIRLGFFIQNKDVTDFRPRGGNTSSRGGRSDRYGGRGGSSQFSSNGRNCPQLRIQ